MLIIATLLGASILIGVVGKLISLAINILSSAMFVTKIISFIRAALECLSFGMMDQNVVIHV